MESPMHIPPSFSFLFQMGQLKIHEIWQKTVLNEMGLSPHTWDAHWDIVLAYLTRQVLGYNPFIKKLFGCLFSSKESVWECPSILKNLFSRKRDLRSSVQVVDPCNGLARLPCKAEELSPILEMTKCIWSGGQEMIHKYIWSQNSRQKFICSVEKHGKLGSWVHLPAETSYPCNLKSLKAMEVSSTSLTFEFLAQQIPSSVQYLWILLNLIKWRWSFNKRNIIV